MPGDGRPVNDSDDIDRAEADYDRRLVNIQRRLDNGDSLELLAAYLDDICATGLRACAALRHRQDIDKETRDKFAAVHSHMARVQTLVDELLATDPGKAITKDLVQYLADSRMGED